MSLRYKEIVFLSLTITFLTTCRQDFEILFFNSTILHFKVFYFLYFSNQATMCATFVIKLLGLEAIP